MMQEVYDGIQEASSVDTSWVPLVATIVLPTVTALIGLFAGTFGKTFLDRYYNKAEKSMTQKDIRDERERTANESAREWLNSQLKERDTELELIRQSERALLVKVGDMGIQLARQDERIEMLMQQMTKVGIDFEEMKKERNYYRDTKHDNDQRLTSELLRRSMVEKDLEERNRELDRAKGQMENMAIQLETMTRQIQQQQQNSPSTGAIS